MGPAALSAALLDLDFGNQNPCVKALKEAVAEHEAALDEGRQDTKSKE